MNIIDLFIDIENIIDDLFNDIQGTHYDTNYLDYIRLKLKPIKRLKLKPIPSKIPFKRLILKMNM